YPPTGVRVAPVPPGLPRPRDRNHLHVLDLPGSGRSDRPLGPFVRVDARRYAHRCTTLCLRQTLHASAVLATRRVPMSLGSASLRRRGGNPVIRMMQSAQRAAVPMLSSISAASRFRTGLQGKRRNTPESPESRRPYAAPTRKAEVVASRSYAIATRDPSIPT